MPRIVPVVQAFRPAFDYDTLTTAMTGDIEYEPLPSCFTDWSPLKSTRMVVAPEAVTSNSRFNFTSPEFTVTLAFVPAGAAIAGAQAAPVDALSKYSTGLGTTI